MTDNADTDEQYAYHMEMEHMEMERQHQLLEALMDCKRAGTDLDTIELLAGALGLYRRWKQYEAATQP